MEVMKDKKNVAKPTVAMMVLEKLLLLSLKNVEDPISTKQVLY